MAWLTRAPRPWERILIVVLLVGLAATIRVVIPSSLWAGTSYITFYPAIMLAALFGGLLPGMAATAGSAVMVFYLMRSGVISPGGLAPTIGFLFTGSLMSVVCEGLLRARMRIQTLNDQLTREVAEHKTAEENLRVKDSAIESSISGIAIARLDGGLTYVNGSYVRMWGYEKAEEVLGKSIAEFVDDPSTMALGVDAVKSSGGWVGDFLARRKDGTTFNAQLVTSRVDDKAGHPLRILASFLDVSERKSAEERLRTSEGKYRQIVETTHDGIWMIDTEDKTTFVNRRMAEILGHTPEEMIGRPLLSFLAADVLEDVETRLKGHRQGFSESFERRFLRKDGAEVWVLMSTNPLPSHDGAYSGALAVATEITDRKRAEERLRASEERYRQIVETTHDGIWMIDAESRTTFVNRRMAEMLGYTPEEMTGQPIFKFMTDDARATAERNVERRKKGIAEEHDFCLQRKGGAEVWTIMEATPLLAPDGTYAGALATVTNITERKKAEETLRASSETHRSVLQTAMDGFWLADAKGHLLEVNEAYSRMSGYSQRELLTMRISDFEANEKPEETDSHMQALVTGGYDRFETRHRRRDGTVFDVEVSTQHKTIEDGRVVAFLRDMTERKLAETQIERMTRLYQALIGVGEAIVRASTPGELFREICRVLVESGCFKMAWMGWRDVASPQILVVGSHGDHTGYLDGIRVFADRRPEGMGPTGTAIREGKPYVCSDFSGDPRTLPWRGAAARAGWRSSAAFPVRFGGETSGALTVYSLDTDVFGDREVSLLERAATDISFAMEKLEHEVGQRQAEERVRQLNSDLEQRVQERTAELEAANRELDAFSHSVSHDLRAPLRAITGFSAKVVKSHSGQLDTEGQRLLGVISSNAQRMSVLIDDLLAFSRTARAEVRHTRLDMEEIARSVFEEVAGGPETRTKTEFQLGELPNAEGDAPLLRQVWVNLLSNAVKYSSHAEKPVVEVTGEIEGDFAVYRVRDNGVGFDMAYADKLFGVFQRLHGVAEFEGTGIGLALVKQVVTRHGGQVRAEGEVGKGATFSFSLPVVALSGLSTSLKKLVLPPGTTNIR